MRRVKGQGSSEGRAAETGVVTNQAATSHPRMSTEGLLPLYSSQDDSFKGQIMSYPSDPGSHGWSPRELTSLTLNPGLKFFGMAAFSGPNYYPSHLSFPHATSCTELPTCLESILHSHASKSLHGLVPQCLFFMVQAYLSVECKFPLNCKCHEGKSLTYLILDFPESTTMFGTQ